MSYHNKSQMMYHYKFKLQYKNKLLDVEERIADLARMRDGLRTLIAACPGHGRAADCPILKALGAEDAR